MKSQSIGWPCAGHLPPHPPCCCCRRDFRPHWPRRGLCPGCCRSVSRRRPGQRPRRRQRRPRAGGGRPEGVRGRGGPGAPVPRCPGAPVPGVCVGPPLPCRQPPAGGAAAAGGGGRQARGPARPPARAAALGVPPEAAPPPDADRRPKRETPREAVHRPPPHGLGRRLDAKPRPCAAPRGSLAAGARLARRAAGRRRRRMGGKGARRRERNQRRAAEEKARHPALQAKRQRGGADDRVGVP